MEILKIETEDYTLSVQADNVAFSFSRALKRNEGMLNSTTYSFSGSAVNSFELLEPIDNKLAGNLASFALGENIHPVFFENKDYLIDIIFKTKTDDEPKIISHLKDIPKGFISRKIKDAYFLTGAINYGNEIGKTGLNIRYVKNGITYNNQFEFEVFPVKLDYKNDYNDIVRDINKEFSSLVLDLLKKTYSGFKKGDEVSNDLIWWSVFGNLYKDVLRSASLILNKPHNKLVTEVSYNKADKIKRLTPALEEQIAEHYHHNENKYYREERKTLTVDTNENRFFKYVATQIHGKFKNIKTKLFQQQKVRTKMSEEFRQELEGIENKLLTIVNHPFLKQIGDFKGLKQESLVLQKASGYSSLFRSWIILKKGINFLDGVNRIELKSIDELYQIWCFLEMKNIVSEILGGIAPKTDLAEILVEGFTLKLGKDRKSRVCFNTKDGQTIELFHELYYDNDSDYDTRSHTVKQEPDIVLQISKEDLKENYKLTYLFDAKYRLRSDDNPIDKDSPPEDAINQMHRYRDAIFFNTEKTKQGNKKEVIGAYVLFPGANEVSEIEKLYYHKSIEEVNIGAFPLLPGSKKERNNSLLKDFLTEILTKKSTSNILNEELIPQKGMHYDNADGVVLIGITNGKLQNDYLNSDAATIYHMPVKLHSKEMNDLYDIGQIRFIAPDISGIKFYFEVKNISMKPRNEIFPSDHSLYKSKTDSYYVFELGNRKELKKAIETNNTRKKNFEYKKLSQLLKS